MPCPLCRSAWSAQSQMALSGCFRWQCKLRTRNFRPRHWFCRRARSRLNWYFLRVTVRHRRCSASGTKLSVSSRATSRFTRRSASTKSLFRPRRPRLDSAAQVGKMRTRARCGCALSIERLEGSRWRLRQMRGYGN